jgi:hypothetical protein
MHYEINVSHEGRHLFATHERSIRSVEECKRVLEEVVKRFPKEDGFTVTVTRYDNVGKNIDPQVILRPKGTRAKATY